MELKLIDTNGDENKTEERHKAFLKDVPDCFMIFFAIDDEVSFENVGAWLAECQNLDHTIPAILVGSKADLREH